MTGGTVVVLGPVGPNFGAGMTGGRAYVFDPDGQLHACLNHELVMVAAADEADDELRALLDAHRRRTGSPRAAKLLASWASSAALFRRVEPRADVAAVTGADEAADAASEGV
jgi:glutamate synthase domain-containing protein 3